MILAFLLKSGMLTPHPPNPMHGQLRDIICQLAAEQCMDFYRKSKKIPNVYEMLQEFLERNYFHVTSEDVLKQLVHQTSQAFQNLILQGPPKVGAVEQPHPQLQQVLCQAVAALCISSYRKHKRLPNIQDALGQFLEDNFLEVTAPDFRQSLGHQTSQAFQNMILEQQ